jgi:hypothetical protein
MRSLLQQLQGINIVFVNIYVVRKKPIAEVNRDIHKPFWDMPPDPD